MRLVLVETLEDLGYLVESVRTAAEALESLRLSAGRFDVAILDVGLPDRRGDALAVEIRALCADLPIVIATGHDQEELRARFRDDRLVALFAKPYSVPDIMPVLASLGVRHPAEREGPA